MSDFITKLVLNFEADRSVRSVSADYAEMVGGREMGVGRKNLNPTDIEQHLPTTAALLAQLQAAQAGIETLTAERDAAVEVAEQKAGEAAALKTQLDTVRSQLDAATVQLNAANSRIAALTA